jgi:hypothetical protein
VDLVRLTGPRFEGLLHVSGLFSLMDAQEHHPHGAKVIIKEAVCGDAQHPLSREPVTLGLLVQEGITRGALALIGPVKSHCELVSTVGPTYFLLVLCYADLSFLQKNAALTGSWGKFGPNVTFTFPAHLF